MSTRRPGIVTRSQSGFCHGDCKSPLIEELSASKRPSTDSEISDMSDTESGPDLREFCGRWINYSANTKNIYMLNLTKQLFGNRNR